MKRTRTLIMLCLLTLTLTSCSLLPEEEVFLSAPIIREYAAEPYETAVVERGDLILTEQLRLSYVPVQTAVLSFSLDGEFFDDIFVSVGDTVAKGQLLAQLQLGDFPAQMKSIINEAARQELELRQLEQRRTLALKRASQTAEGEAAAELGRRIDEINETYDLQASRLKDDLTLQQIRLSECEDRIAERQLIAPFDGAVTYVKRISPGDRSGIGDRVVAVADSAMSLFCAKTKYWNYFTEGEEVVISAKKADYRAVVTSEESLGLTPTEHTEEKEAPVYFVLTEPAFDLEDGDHGSLTLTLDERHDVLIIPEQAVTLANGEPIVYFQDENGVKSYKYIKTGLKADHRFEVLEGLTEGEQLIFG